MTVIKYYKNKCISLSASTGPGLIVQPGLPLLPSPSYPAQVCDTSRAAAGPAPGQSHTDSAGGKPWRFWERFSHTISTAWFQFTEERFLVITQPQMQPFSCFFFLSDQFRAYSCPRQLGTSPSTSAPPLRLRSTKHTAPTQRTLPQSSRQPPHPSTKASLSPHGPPGTQSSDLHHFLHNTHRGDQKRPGHLHPCPHTAHSCPITYLPAHKPLSPPRGPKGIKHLL